MMSKSNPDQHSNPAGRPTEPRRRSRRLLQSLLVAAMLFAFQVSANAPGSPTVLPPELHELPHDRRRPPDRARSQGRIAAEGPRVAGQVHARPEGHDRERRPLRRTAPAGSPRGRHAHGLGHVQGARRRAARPHRGRIEAREIAVHRPADSRRTVLGSRHRPRSRHLPRARQAARTEDRRASDATRQSAFRGLAVAGSDRT